MKHKNEDEMTRKAIVIMDEIKRNVMTNLKDCLSELEKRNPGQGVLLDGACVGAMIDVLGELGAFSASQVKEEYRKEAIERFVHSVGMAVVVHMQMNEMKEKGKRLSTALKN